MARRQLHQTSTAFAASLALILAWILGGGLVSPVVAADWISAPSTYSHHPQTGERVYQYQEKPPVYAAERTDFLRSGYRHIRSTLRAGGSADFYHVVEEWGRPVRPYGEWQRPYRPYSVPYAAWGPPYAGLGYPLPYPGPYYPGPYPHGPRGGYDPGPQRPARVAPAGGVGPRRSPGPSPNFPRVAPLPDLVP